jgi:hypothetical protein
LPFFLFAFLFMLFADCQDLIMQFSSCSSCLRTVRPLSPSIQRNFKVFLTNKGLSVRQHGQNRSFVTNNGLTVRQTAPSHSPQYSEYRKHSVPLFRSDVMAWRACFACFFMLSVALPFIDLAMTCASSI